jgi:DNA (cytosine-5)-methyltransferase 1
MFDLNVIRHRYFESSFIMSNPSECKHTKKVVKHGRKPTEDNYAGLSGHFSGIDFARNSAGISWMVRNELSQAIPPAYTYWIGTQLIRQI